MWIEYFLIKLRGILNTMYPAMIPIKIQIIWRVRKNEFESRLGLKRELALYIDTIPIQDKRINNANKSLSIVEILILFLLTFYYAH